MEYLRVAAAVAAILDSWQLEKSNEAAMPELKNPDQHNRRIDP